MSALMRQRALQALESHDVSDDTRAIVYAMLHMADQIPQ